jgi:hypothetical protein
MGSPLPRVRVDIQGRMLSRDQLQQCLLRRRLRVMSVVPEE